METHQKGYLDLKVGYTCNNDCIHCVIQDYKTTLISKGIDINCTTDECLEIIANAPQRGVGTITITGGEPTIRPDFFDLLKACQSAGLKVGVQTNGRRFHSQEFCERLEDCGAPNFVIALHGPDCDVHDAISRRAGSFEQTRQGIKNLCESGHEVTGKLVISRLNAPSLVATMDLMTVLGIKKACFAFPHGHGNARVHYPEIAPRYAEIRPEIDRLTRKAAESGFQISLEAFPLCVLNDPQYVLEFQYLLPVERRCIPSNADEFDWDMMRPFDKKKFPQCTDCCFDPYCEGAWKEYPATYGDKEFQPVAEEKMLDLLAFGVAMKTAKDE